MAHARTMSGWWEKQEHVVTDLSAWSWLRLVLWEPFVAAVTSDESRMAG